MILYTTGYSGIHHDEYPLGADNRIGKFEAFEAFVRANNIIVLDVRLRPYSKAECWQRPFMERHLGRDHYRSITNLGNDNYNTGGEWQIHDWQTGLSELFSAISAQPVVPGETGLIPLILGASDDPDCCHRTLIAKTLRDMGHTVIEVRWWEGFIKWESFWASAQSESLRVQLMALFQERTEGTVASCDKRDDITVRDVLPICDRHNVSFFRTMQQLAEDGLIAPVFYQGICRGEFASLRSVRKSIEKRAKKEAKA